MNRRFLFLSIICVSVFLSGQIYANGKPVSKGTPLPKIVFKDTISGETMKYLGLSRKMNFSLDQVRGSFFIIEVFSTFCMSCPKNVAVLNDVYDAVEKDADSRGKIKIFGVAIGNTNREAEGYKTAYSVRFPILTDFNFSVHDILGNPRVPYTLYVKKTAKGKIIVDVHQGVLDSAETVLKKVRSLN